MGVAVAYSIDKFAFEEVEIVDTNFQQVEFFTKILLTHFIERL